MEYELYSDIAYLGVVIFLGIVFNSIIPLAISLKRKSLISYNIFILNIAIIDLIICLYILPVALVNRILSRNAMGEVGCLINSFVTFFTMGINNSFYMIIAFDRYLCTFHKLRHSQFFTTNKTILVVITIWLFWLVYGLTLSFYQGFDYEDEGYVCFLSDGKHNVVVLVVLGCINFLMPICVSTVFYSKLLISLLRARRNVKQLLSKNLRNNQEVRMIMILIVTVAIFFVCWAPYTFHGVLVSHGVKLTPMVHKVISWSALTNYTLNGWLFGVMNLQFRRTIKNFVKFNLFQWKTSKVNSIT